MLYPVETAQGLVFLAIVALAVLSVVDIVESGRKRGPWDRR